MKDIANHCGVSVATVSKALSGQTDIGQATREKIIAAAKELGYTGNYVARALKTNRTYNLGIVFEDLQNSGFMHEYFAAILNSFRFEAERFGYDITFLNRGVGGEGTSYLQHALYRAVDGVALICADFFSPQVQELVSSDIPVVTLDHAFNNRTAVLSDNIIGMETLVRYAYEKGHRKIAYIRGNPTAVTENRLTGFYRTCEELGLNIPDEYMMECEYHEPRGCSEATKKLLALRDRPTCILFSDDYSGIGGINAILEAGLHIPEDISIMGYDGIHLAGMLSPRLTTWRQNADDLGKIAAEKLVLRIENPRTTPAEYIVVKGQLLEGGTVRQIDGQ